MKTFIVTYTKHIGGEGSIIVKAHDEAQAIKNAKFVCFTGSNFRDAEETKEKYVKPRKQGFFGRH